MTPAAKPGRFEHVLRADTDAAQAAGDTPVEALQKRIKLLKKRLEQLQQHLRQANARMAAVTAGRYRNDEARTAAIMKAKSQVVSLNSAVSVALSSLFEAEKALIGSVNLSI
ncbi:hypothetical protein AA042_00555 [Pseudomonas lundensis]|nr:hypothetical protein AA042_00555 [Pseudomonas lundensis]